mmetsp:Transcript_82259/g.145755  ORF Transcript_82259/g.145755 Transcript_82259/m.145755 type:complete len:589 (-) Transcript_82259:122-1888(-)
MIKYKNVAFHPRLLFQAKGSPFPIALLAAVPCAALGVVLQVFRRNDIVDSEHFFSTVLNNNAGYTSFTFLCGFMIVFRTQQGYGRFVDGLTNLKAMQAEWYCAASNLVAFCRHSKCEPHEVRNFHHILLRLMSMLHAVALAELEGKEEEDKEPVAFKLELIDARGIDPESLESLREVECLVELIVQWVQSLTVMHINSGVLSIPPPILARVFHNLSNGLSSFHQAKKLADVPYPFPFMQATEWLLVLHWMITPIVMTNFTDTAVWTGVFSFLATFILWTLNTIATELENPFGEDDNDLHTEEMQVEMNKRYLTLLWPQASRIPTLSSWAILDEAALHHPQSMLSLQDVWEKMDKTAPADRTDKTRRGQYFRMPPSQHKKESTYSSRVSTQTDDSVLILDRGTINLDRGDFSRRNMDSTYRFSSWRAVTKMSDSEKEKAIAEAGPKLTRFGTDAGDSERNSIRETQYTVASLRPSVAETVYEETALRPSVAYTEHTGVIEEELYDQGRSSEEQPWQLPARPRANDPGAKFNANECRQDGAGASSSVARLNYGGDPRGVGNIAGALRENERIAEGPGDVGPDPSPPVGVL